MSMTNEAEIDEPYAVTDGQGYTIMINTERKCLKFARQNERVLFVSPWTDRDSVPIFEREEARVPYRYVPRI